MISKRTLFARFAFFVVCLNIAAASPNFKDDVLNHLRRLQHTNARSSVFAPETLAAFQSTVGGGSVGRGLKGMDACTWDELTSTCGISTEVASAMLEKADNPVARYLHRIFECYQYYTHDTCESNGCVWYDMMCSYTFKDYKDLTASPCLDNADHIVDTVAWSVQCSDIEEEYACNVHDHCYWLDSDYSKKCVFDRWTYYFGIQTIDSAPEGFDELFTLRTEQLATYFESNFDDSNAEESANEVLYTTLPEFDCPFGYEPLVCRYVEAISQLAQVTYYCTKKYTTEAGCFSDQYCQVLIEQDGEFCAASDNQALISIFEGEKVFNGAIEYPDARKLEDKRLQCEMKSSSYACKGDCQWTYDGMCLLSGQWIEEYIYELIGDSDDPVCQYFVLSTTTGCIDRDSEFQCDFDEKCYWSAANAYCIAGTAYSVEMALDISDHGCEFRNISELCEAADTKRACKRVSDYDPSADGMSDSAHASHANADRQSSHTERSNGHVSVSVQSNAENESSEIEVHKKSSNYLWLLILPAGLVLVGVFFAWRYRKSIEGLVTSGRNRMQYQPVEDAELH